jgi:NADPH:quinone reductase-like Zn-dependent oxidoreductase
MKAAVLEGQDQPFAIQEADKPDLASGEALVQVDAAALNHRDVWIKKGLYPGLQFPIILGSDGAGVVEEVADGFDNGWQGREVIINPSINWGENERVQSKNFRILGLPDNGTFGEFVKVPATNLVAKPPHLDASQAAALPLAGLTAYRALFTRADLQPGEKVLVTGAGGGVSQFAVLFALAVGAEVYVTSGSQDKIDKTMNYGAQGGVNYKDADWANQLKQQAGRFQVIIDSAAGDNFGHLIDLADMGGRIAIYGGTLGNIDGLNPQKLFWKQVSILGSTMGSDRDFAQMVELVSHYRIEPVIDQVFDLNQIEEALTRMEQAQQLGKVVLRVS